MITRRLAALVAAVPLALAAPVPAANAATTPPVSTPPPSAALTFIPPTVAPLRVTIGATYLHGKLISPGVDVATRGVSLPPLTWTPPTR
jgi:hypothetical protein